MHFFSFCFSAARSVGLDKFAIHAAAPPKNKRKMFLRVVRSINRSSLAGFQQPKIEMLIAKGRGRKLPLHPIRAE
jgi:hypothetical protein